MLFLHQLDLPREVKGQVWHWRADNLAVRLDDDSAHLRHCPDLAGDSLHPLGAFYRGVRADLPLPRGDADVHAEEELVAGTVDPEYHGKDEQA